MNLADSSAAYALDLEFVFLLLPSVSLKPLLKKKKIAQYNMYTCM